MRTVKSFAGDDTEKARYGAEIEISYDLGVLKAGSYGAFMGLISFLSQVLLLLNYGMLVGVR